MTTNDLLQQLPEQCRPAIEPRHKMVLAHYLMTDGTVWVVLNTRMPGDSSKAWHLTKREYWDIEPRHEHRDRWIREKMKPTLEADRNPMQLALAI